ncbi:MAG: hypothetical protein L0Y71_02510 [Gemmataceae bacterium]|nr:hypothetical protein [Gemmataceae bacterium]
MSYLPDNPSQPRHPELYRSLPLAKSTGPTAAGPAARIQPSADGWSANAFGYTVFCLGCVAVMLMAWGAYSALPGPGLSRPGLSHHGKSEKSLRAAQTLPKLKVNVSADEPPLAEMTQVAALQPPPPPPPPVEAPAAVPLKIDTPPAIVAPMNPPIRPEPIEIPAVPIPFPDGRGSADAAPMKLEPAPIPPPPSYPAAPVMAAPMPMVEAAAPVVPAHQGPMILLGQGNLGETPMIRNWKTLALYSLLAVAPVATPTPLAAAGGVDEKTQKRIDEMLTTMNEAIKALNQATQGIGELRKDVRGVQTDIDSLKTAAVKLRADVDGSATRVDDLQKLIGNLDAEVKYLRKRVNDSGVPSGRPTTDKASLDELMKQLSSIEQAILKLKSAEPRVSLSPPAATGKVILANMYHEELLFIINGKRHRVPPVTVSAIEAVPAGTLTYEVLSPTWGERARSTTNLPANETFTLTAR